MSKYTKKDVDNSYFDDMYKGVTCRNCNYFALYKPEFANDSIDDIVKIVEDKLKIRENYNNSKYINDLEDKND